MLTKITDVTESTVSVASEDERVTVTVDRRDGDGFARGPLTRQEAHEVLTKVEATTQDFLAAVEADVHDTSSNA